MGISNGFAVTHEDEPPENSPELICSYDLSGNVIDVNHGAERIIGY